MAGDDELELNTLNRFAKHSPRLVLEEYSHCEVPAGCGGAILRWRDPAEGVPLQLALAADGDVTVLVDGSFVGGRFSLKPGTHTLAIALTGARTPAIAAALHLSVPGGMTGSHTIWTTTEHTRISRSHVEGWGRAGFDDSSWARPEDLEIDLGNREWRYNQLVHRGATIIPTLGPDLWLRDTFEVKA